MNPLQHFDNRFGNEHNQSQVEQMFVYNVESAIFEQLQWDKYPGVSYYFFMKDLCIALGLNREDYKNQQSSNYKELKQITKSDFLQTMRVLIAAYFVLTDSYKPAAEKLSEEIQKLLRNLPAPLNIRWYKGIFYKDDIPELSDLLLDETLDWLAAYPAARIDLQLALQNYTNKNTTGILDNVYKAIENVAQRITGVTVGLHDPAILSALSRNFQLNDYWKGQFNRFIIYANDVSRHGKNEGRHEVPMDEIEAFLFLAIILLRMVIRKKQSLLAQPVSEESVLLYLKTSDIVKRIEQQVAAAFPAYKTYEEEEHFIRYSLTFLQNNRELKWSTIQNIEDAFLKHERKLVVLQQKEVEDWPDNSIFMRGMALEWLMYFYFTDEFS